MPRILIAEPSKTLAALVKLSLAELGADLEVAHDGSAALAAARARLPDALVCDQGLPGLDGFALAQTLKQLAAEAGRPPIVTLMLVPENTTPDPERLAYVGIGDVLTKPFERAVLLERVRAMLDAGKPTALPARSGHAPTTMAHGAALAPIAAEPPVDLEPLLAHKLPAIVEATVQRMLPALVQAHLERAVADRVAPIVEAAVQRALATLVTPAGIERAVSAEARAAIGEVAERVEGRLEKDLLERLDRFARESLPARLQTHAEQIIWKIVPTIAEDIVKDEIKRLTQEPS